MGWKTSNFHGCLAAGAGLAETAQPCSWQIAGFGPGAALAQGVNVAGAVWASRGRAGDSVTSQQPSVPFPSTSPLCSPPPPRACWSVLLGREQWCSATSSSAEVLWVHSSSSSSSSPGSLQGLLVSFCILGGGVVAGCWPRSGRGAAGRTWVGKSRKLCVLGSPRGETAEEIPLHR